MGNHNTVESQQSAQGANLVSSLVQLNSNLTSSPTMYTVDLVQILAFFIVCYSY